jgi:hypothetical protein
VLFANKVRRRYEEGVKEMINITFLRHSFA